MTNNEQDNLNQQSCCPTGECPTEGGGGGFFKTLRFAIIIILALGITAYSIFYKKDAGGPECESGKVPEPLEYLSTVPGLQEELADYDFALLVFPGNSDEIPKKTAQTLDNSMKIIQSKSPKAQMIILSPDVSYYQDAIDKYIITGFPAVLALGRYGNRLLIAGGISDLKILAAYNDISAPPKCCSSK